MKRLRRALAVLALVFAGQVANLAVPAWACGCGAYIPDRAGASVVDERALVAWDGHTENILMSLQVTGSSDKAAWLMPVPAAAQVTLGEAKVFDELARITAPRIEYRDSWWPTFDWLGRAPEGSFDGVGARPGGTVNVLSTQRIGPFDVTRLRGADPAALADWLAGKGFPHPDGLDGNLAPYVADGWEIVAVQLAPDSGSSLTGALQPLRLSFAADKVIYPMRLSRSATTPQSVDLSVLAEHRMDPTSLPVAGNAPALQYAGPATLAPFTGSYLTRWTNRIALPAQIDGDYVFTQAQTDTNYQQVIVRTRDHGAVTGLALIAGALAAVAVAVVAVVRRRRTVG